LYHELGKVAFKEHKRLLVIVGMEECALDVDGGNVASLVGINGGSDHDAVGCNGWGGSVFLLVSRLGAFFAAICDCLCADSSNAFLDNIHE
jgi:hypothetical protein